MNEPENTSPAIAPVAAMAALANVAAVVENRDKAAAALRDVTVVICNEPVDLPRLIASLCTLGQAFVDGEQGRYGMRIPAEPYRDGDLVCGRALLVIQRLALQLVEARAQLKVPLPALLPRAAELLEQDAAELTLSHTVDGEWPDEEFETLAYVEEVKEAAKAVRLVLDGRKG
jgi:hypothetical protein